MRKHILGRLLLAVLPVAMLVGCSGTQAADVDSQDSQPKNVVATDGPKDPAEVIPQQPAPSEVCADMDKLFEKFLTESPQGKAFTETDSSDVEKVHQAWSVTAAEFLNQHHSELQTIARNDNLAKDALAALEKYVDIDGKLASGDISEFVDPAKAQEDIKVGKDPERDPRFLTASEELTQAHITLTQCMPHWPVVF